MPRDDVARALIGLPASMNGYEMYEGDPEIMRRLMELSNRPGLTNDELLYGGKAYAQDYQKRMEAMQQPEGPFGQMGFDERRAAQSDRENNMFFAMPYRKLGI